jgi:hypothetical protein
MDITATAGGLSLSMPSALQSSTGEDILVKNVGSNTFTLKDYNGGTITTVTAGAAIYVYLKDVSTAAGVWATVAFGVGSSSVNAASLVGFGVKAISASLNQSHPASIANVTFTIGASDRAQLYLTSVGITINLPAAIGIGNDFFFLVRNVSTGNTTIDANGAELIDGAGTVVLAPEESCLVCCTGTTWYTVGRGRSTVFEYTQLTKNVAGNSNVTLTGSEASNSILKFIGALTGNINIIVPNVTAIWYVDNSTSGPYSLTVKTSAGTGISITVGNRVILYGDGVNIQSAQTVFATSGAFDTGSASAPSITFVSDTDTGAYNSGANQFGVTVGGTQVANFTSSGLTVTGTIVATNTFPIISGGTGATNQTDARTNLGISATNTPNTPAGNIAATTVQAAINELDSEKLAVAGGTMTGALTLSSTAPYIAFNETDQAAGSRNWLTSVDGSNFQIRTVDDAYAPIATPLSITRTGNVTITGSYQSPSLAGTPIAPTAAANTNTTQIATTEYTLERVNRAGTNSQGIKTISTSNPSSGASGDIWYKV